MGEGVGFVNLKGRDLQSKSPLKFTFEQIKASALTETQEQSST